LAELRGLVAAAGRGTRAGLPYPKTLYPVQGKPILVRIHELLAPVDPLPTVIVSPGGLDDVRACLQANACATHLVVQPEPRGMGDAVLRFRDSPAYSGTDHVVLVWGDIPFLQPETLAATLQVHFEQDNDFTFPTRHVDVAYTVVSRGPAGGVIGVQETREVESVEVGPGEREVGLFVFRLAPVFELLDAELPGKWGGKTGEHGFLYLVEHLVKAGHRVVGIPIATKLDLVSLNSLKDIEAHL
jgi:bifunctional N-acetylglucosamine-1-phosphate-uridyltransferase/glucosamine-1-phosphate-acetyltransferase GlmU-like protein